MGWTGSIVIVLSLSQLLLARAVEKSYLSHSSTEDVVFVSGTVPLDDAGDQVGLTESCSGVLPCCSREADAVCLYHSPDQLYTRNFLRLLGEL